MTNRAERRRQRHGGFRAFGRKGIAGPEQDALAAASLFIAYHIECERFDVTVCTGQQTPDGRLPRDTVETGIISRHTQIVANELRKRANRLGLPRAVLEAADEFVNDMPYAKVVADYPQALRIIGGPLS